MPAIAVSGPPKASPAPVRQVRVGARRILEVGTPAYSTIWMAALPADGRIISLGGDRPDHADVARFT